MSAGGLLSDRLAVPVGTDFKKPLCFVLQNSRRRYRGSFFRPSGCGICARMHWPKAGMNAAVTRPKSVAC